MSILNVVKSLSENTVEPVTIKYNCCSVASSLSAYLASIDLNLAGSQTVLGASFKSMFAPEVINFGFNLGFNYKLGKDNKTFGDCKNNWQRSFNFYSMCENYFFSNGFILVSTVRATEANTDTSLEKYYYKPGVPETNVDDVTHVNPSYMSIPSAIGDINVTANLFQEVNISADNSVELHSRNNVASNDLKSETNYVTVTQPKIELLSQKIVLKSGENKVSIDDNIECSCGTTKITVSDTVKIDGPQASSLQILLAEIKVNGLSVKPTLLQVPGGNITTLIVNAKQASFS